MAKVELFTQAPEFSLTSFDGSIIRLTDYRGKSNVLLIFNRTFT